MRNIIFIFFFLPFVVYSQKKPGGTGTGPTNPPAAPPILYIINIDSPNENISFNSDNFIFSTFKNNLSSCAYRRENLIDLRNVL